MPSISVCLTSCCPHASPRLTGLTLPVRPAVTTPPAGLYALTRWQAGLQGSLRPGLWLPGLRTPHMFEETWRAASSPSVCLLAVVRAAKQLRRGLKCQVKTV